MDLIPGQYYRCTKTTIDSLKVGDLVVITSYFQDSEAGERDEVTAAGKDVNYGLLRFCHCEMPEMQTRGGMAVKSRAMRFHAIL